MQLYELDEVQEVHSVHGNIDILVKVVLKRDFLASDAETIAEFVDQNIRRLEGHYPDPDHHSRGLQGETGVLSFKKPGRVR